MEYGLVSTSSVAQIVRVVKLYASNKTINNWCFSTNRRIDYIGQPNSCTIKIINLFAPFICYTKHQHSVRLFPFDIKQIAQLNKVRLSLSYQYLAKCNCFACSFLLQLSYDNNCTTILVYQDRNTLTNILKKLCCMQNLRAGQWRSQAVRRHIVGVDLLPNQQSLSKWCVLY